LWNKEERTLLSGGLRLKKKKDVGEALGRGRESKHVFNSKRKIQSLGQQSRWKKAAGTHSTEGKNKNKTMPGPEGGKKKKGYFHARGEKKRGGSG